jgi:hypothetical protein
MSRDRPRIDLYPGPDLLAELRAYAISHGLSVSAAACSAVEVGLASLQQSDEPTRTEIDALAARIEQAETMLHLMGPPLVALPSLIAYWAVKSEALCVSEQELLDEVSYQGETLWQSELTAVEQALKRRSSEGQGR